MNYQEAVTYILNIPRFSRKTSLAHTRLYLEQLGNPDGLIHDIHVAGTNGKGSVCAYINGILQEAGCKVGMFTSPHLISLNERIRINDNIVTDQEFLETFIFVKECVKKLEKMGIPHPSFFEFLLLMAVLVFARKGVDYAILETGLGGRLDATNVIREPVACVITPISLDHTEILGDTIQKIAAEKAGIIKRHVPVVFWAEQISVNQVIEERAVACDTKLYKLTKKDYKVVKKMNKHIDFYPLCGYYEYVNITLPSLAVYQVDNAMLAIRTIEAITEGTRGRLANKRVEGSIIRKGILNAKWEGRMEEVLPDVILDGAHNNDAIEHFIADAGQYKAGNRRYILFSAVADKDYKGMIQNLAVNLEHEAVIITKTDNQRALDLDVMKHCFELYTDKPIYVYEDNKEALHSAFRLKGADGILFCIGSLYLIGSLKRIIKEEELH